MKYLVDLNIDDKKIYQTTDGYAFSSDSVLLANLAHAKHSDKVLDLGTGTGIIATLVALKQNPAKVVGIEIQEDVASLARESVSLNGLEDQIKIINGDIKQITKYVNNEEFDIIVANPPYFDIVSGTDTDSLKAIQCQQNAKRALSRTMINANLADFVKAGKYALKFGGYFYLIIKVDKLAEVLTLLTQNNLEAKHLTFVYPKHGGDIDTVIIKSKKGAKSGLSTTSLYLRNSDGTYTEDGNRYCLK